MSEVWVKFGVKVANVERGGLLYLVGNCSMLGEWRSQDAVPMRRQPYQQLSQEEDIDISYWVTSVKLPKKTTIRFRYFIGSTSHPHFCESMGEASNFSIGVEVMLWETNIEPRQVITPDADEYEIPVASFGSYGGEHTVSQGWLENQTCVEVRFHNNPIFMRKPKHRRQVYSIKCSPLNYECDLTDESINDPTSFFRDESSLEGPPICNRTGMLFYNLSREETLKPSLPPPTGCIYNQDDYLVFISRGFNQNNLGFQIDFYVHEKETARYIGTAHLLPPKVDVTVFSKRIPIIGLNHRPIGEIEVETLRVTPLVGYDWKMDVSYQNHWKRKHCRTPLNVGHRGMGSSYKRVANVKENTIHSLFSAAEHGADFVEFDVLLTKDLVPVIYHDFSICLSTARRGLADSMEPYQDHTREDEMYFKPQETSNDKDFLEVSVKDLCLKKLQSLKLFHSSATSSEVDEPAIEVTGGEVQEDHDPFPTLQRCLERVGTNLGFNIEIKYPQLIESGESEAENYFDLNLFIDCILDVILKHAADRRIIFSSFHADACIMLNRKQNKYPVLFLSNGPTTRYTPYQDWRCTTFHHGIRFAKSEGLLGVDFQAEGLLQDLPIIPYIRSMGLVLFVWGEDLNEEPVKATLRKERVDAIIFDRIDHPQPESFLVESKSFDDIQETITSPTFSVHKNLPGELSSSSASGTCVDRPAFSAVQF